MKDESPDLKKRTKTYALEIIDLYSSLPRTTVVQVIGKQFLRSGTSVGANFAEAHRARSNAEFVFKVGESLKELEETRYWLDLLNEASVVLPKPLNNLMDETNQLTAILTSVSKKVQARL